MDDSTKKKSLEEILNPIVDKFLTEGNYHEYHFLDSYIFPIDEELEDKIKYCTEETTMPKDYKEILGVKYMISFSGYVFMIR